MEEFFLYYLLLYQQILIAYAVPKNEHKPVITELYAFLTESMKKRTLVRIFAVLLKKSNFYDTIYTYTLTKKEVQ